MNHQDMEKIRQRCNKLSQEERTALYKRGMEIINSSSELNLMDARSMTAEETQTINTYYESLFKTDLEESEPENELNVLRAYAGKEIFATDFNTAAEMRAALNDAHEEIKQLKYLLAEHDEY